MRKNQEKNKKDINYKNLKSELIKDRKICLITRLKIGTDRFTKEQLEIIKKIAKDEKIL